MFYLRLHSLAGRTNNVRIIRLGCALLRLIVIAIYALSMGYGMAAGMMPAAASCQIGDMNLTRGAGTFNVNLYLLTHLVFGKCPCFLYRCIFLFGNHLFITPNYRLTFRVALLARASELA